MPPLQGTGVGGPGKRPPWAKRSCFLCLTPPQKPEELCQQNVPPPRGAMHLSSISWPVLVLVLGQRPTGAGEEGVLGSGPFLEQPQDLTELLTTLGCWAETFIWQADHIPVLSHHSHFFVSCWWDGILGGVPSQTQLCSLGRQIFFLVCKAQPFRKEKHFKGIPFHASNTVQGSFGDPCASSRSNYTIKAKVFDLL